MPNRYNTNTRRFTTDNPVLYNGQYYPSTTMPVDDGTGNIQDMTVFADRSGNYFNQSGTPVMLQQALPEVNVLAKKRERGLADGASDYIKHQRKLMKSTTGKLYLEQQDMMFQKITFGILINKPFGTNSLQSKKIMKQIFQNIRTKIIGHQNKKDLLYRRNYLKSKLLIAPKDILNSMPKIIGQQFQGEWALYSCSMFAQALVNITIIYPDTKEDNIKIIKELIIKVLSNELKTYDMKLWYDEDPINSLDNGNDIRHLSYRSHLAWMICNYKLIGGGKEYDILLKKLCEAMANGINKSPAMLLPTYKDMKVYLPDMLVAIVALSYYNKVSNGNFNFIVDRWILKAKKEWINHKTGLLASCISYEGNQVLLEVHILH